MTHSFFKFVNVAKDSGTCPVSWLPDRSLQKKKNSSIRMKQLYLVNEVTQIKKSAKAHKDANASKLENESVTYPLNLLELKFLQTSN